MTEHTPLYCPKCDNELEPETLYCAIDHSVAGGVHGVTKQDIESTPRSKRHLLGVTVADAYIITGFLGAGGFGAVYRAEQKALDRDVALKLLVLEGVSDDTIVGRFKREARTSAQLLDPNIVTLFDYGEAVLGGNESDRVFYMAMELVHGPTLRQLIRRTGGPGLDASLQIGINVLSGLDAAHQRGVVHRDLKPPNVLIDESTSHPWHARLFDFGIASLQSAGGQQTQLTQGGVLGTPKYMAPEQWRAQQTAPCTDIYAFGVIMAEMVAGKPPFPKMELVDMAKAHCRKPRPAITMTSKGEPVPPALTAFIAKCMSIDPRDRYGTAGEAIEVLRSIDRDREAASVPVVQSVSGQSDQYSTSGSVLLDESMPPGQVASGSHPSFGNQEAQSGPNPAAIWNPISGQYVAPEAMPPGMVSGSYPGMHPPGAVASMPIQAGGHPYMTGTHSIPGMYPPGTMMSGQMMVNATGQFQAAPPQKKKWALIGAAVVLALGGVSYLVSSRAGFEESGYREATAQNSTVDVLPSPDSTTTVTTKAKPPVPVPAPVPPPKTAEPTPEIAVAAPTIPDAGARDAAREPEKSKPRKRRVNSGTSRRRRDERGGGAIATHVAPPDDAPPPPVDPPKVVDDPAAVSLYDAGLDAERRNAPKAARQFFERSLRMGLTGQKAADADRRIVRLNKEIKRQYEDDSLWPE